MEGSESDVADTSVKWQRDLTQGHINTDDSSLEFEHKTHEATQDQILLNECDWFIKNRICASQSLLH